MKDHNLTYKCWESLGRVDMFDTNNGKRLPTLPKKGGVKRVIGRQIGETCRFLGSYGMGGPGFFGFYLYPKNRYPAEWLVLTMWGADQWLLLDGKWIDCHSDYYDPDKCYFPKWSRFDEGEKQVRDVFDHLTIHDFVIKKKSFKMKLADEENKVPEMRHTLELPNNLTKLPPFGIGQPRKWFANEKMEDGFLISHTEYINI